MESKNIQNKYQRETERKKTAQARVVIGTGGWGVTTVRGAVRDDPAKGNLTDTGKRESTS